MLSILSDESDYTISTPKNTSPDWNSITMPYVDHRKLANELFRIGKPDKLYSSNPQKVKRIRECGNYLSFLHAPASGTTQLFRANFCHNRLCPMCAWRRRVKVFGAYRLAVLSIPLVSSMSYIHMTLTIQNPPITSVAALRESLEHLSNSYRRFRRRLEYADEGRYCLGSHGQMEITINQKAKSWHPHIHVLLLLDQRYYKEQAQLLEMWRECLQGVAGGLRVAKIKPTDGDLYRAVAETCKYPIKFCTKQGNLVIQTEQQYQFLQRALYNMRTSWDTGLIKSAKALQNEDNLEVNQLLEAEQLLIIYTLGFRGGQYQVIRQSEIESSVLKSALSRSPLP